MKINFDLITYGFVYLFRQILIFFRISFLCIIFSNCKENVGINFNLNVFRSFAKKVSQIFFIREYDMRDGYSFIFQYQKDLCYNFVLIVLFALFLLLMKKVDLLYVC
jgi:hypothetical protein